MRYIYALALLLSTAQADELRLVFPIDGLVLTHAYDASSRDGLQVPLVCVASPDATVWINGHRARRVDTNRDTVQVHPKIAIHRAGDKKFLIIHPLTTTLIDSDQEAIFYTNLDIQKGPVLDIVIEAQDRENLLMTTAVCYVRLDPTLTYSITIDDVADVFAEIVAHNYASLFDHPTFAFMKRMHDMYGTVFSLFLFERATIHIPFSLRDMRARYRSEFETNAHWLRLSFHAIQMEPARPYANASYEQARYDYMRIKNHSDRFAGANSWDIFLRSHYWSGSIESVQAWRDAGIRGLYGAVRGFSAYYLSPQKNQILNITDAWRDNEEDITFVQTDIWLEKDATTQEALHAKLTDITSRPTQAQNIQIFTHESYLLPHSPSDMMDRLEEAILWLTAKGYVPRLDLNDPGFCIKAPAPPRHLHMGSGASLFWQHFQREANYRYRILRKSLNAEAQWEQIAEVNTLSFVDTLTIESSAYRIFAVDDAERLSGGSPILMRTAQEIIGSRRSDFNADGRINFLDFIAFAQAYHQSDQTADLNGDGLINLDDLLTFISHFDSE